MMADPKHVQVARDGEVAIARWRTTNRGARLNLFAADLTDADLRGRNLSHADFSTANLRGANLSRCNLLGCRFAEADLRCADFTDANLGYVDLSLANVDGTIFTRARFRRTTLAGLDLSGAVGLIEIEHRAPSSVGVDTLVRSRGRLPTEFLHGCGVPKGIIEYLPSLIGAMEPIQFYSCFISYSHADMPFVQRLHQRLCAAGLNVWVACEDMEPGKPIKEQVESAISVTDKVILVLSRASMGSNWVRHEIGTARRKYKATGMHVLFPISLVPYTDIRDWQAFDTDEGVDLAKEVRAYFVADFTAWPQADQFEAACEKLLKALRGPR